MSTTIMEITPTRPNFFRFHLKLLGRALFSPTEFFRHDLPHFSWSEITTFGIIHAWIATSLAFLLSTFNSLFVASLLDRWAQRLLAADETFSLFGITGKSFIWAAGSLVVLPFMALLQVILGSLMVYVCTRLLVEDNSEAPELVTLRGVARIESAAMVSNWFLLVPFFGGFIAFIVHMVLLTTGIRERFQVSTRRAAAVVLAPYILLFLLAMLLLALMIVGLSQVSVSDFVDPATLGFDFPGF